MQEEGVSQHSWWRSLRVFVCACVCVYVCFCLFVGMCTHLYMCVCVACVCLCSMCVFLCVCVCCVCLQVRGISLSLHGWCWAETLIIICLGTNPFCWPVIYCHVSSVALRLGKLNDPKITLICTRARWSTGLKGWSLALALTHGNSTSNLALNWEKG